MTNYDAARAVVAAQTTGDAARPVMVNTVFWSRDTTLTTTINRATTRTPTPAPAPVAVPDDTAAAEVAAHGGPRRLRLDRH
ncbi:hypothetical protein [Cryobacterium sp. M25]|uniref:hypothetical protein n=1 Tax=Cryobacterium sp. M25 TaxID=2048293 RepID=UPI0011B08F86|nr:hypothetical protein [Cryobacterium sp. M25]